MAVDFVISQELKEQFCREASENLEKFERALAALESEARDQEAIELAFRAIHSIKGNSDYLSLKDINHLAHDLEDLLAGLRKGGVELTPEAISALYQCLDMLREMNRRVLADVYVETDISAIQERLRTLKTAPADAATKPETKPPALDVHAVFLKTSRQHIAFLKKTFERIGAGEPINAVRQAASRVVKTFLISARYVGAQEVAAKVEDVARLLESKDDDAESVASKGAQRLADIEKLLSGKEDAPPHVPKAVAAPDPFSDIRYAEIRIPSAKIDAFMDMVSELILATNSLRYLVEKASLYSLPDEWLHESKRTAGVIDATTRRLRDEISNMRLMKFANVLDRVPRIAREVARASNKKVQVFTSGGEIEVDRKVIEFLVDPLVHIIRNAVDHGVEPPEERKRSGKPEVGSIRVAVEQQGRYAVVQISDDGAGLDDESIKRTALRKGMASAETLDAMNRGELLNLIFVSGFSTKEEATYVSGRGVGLDVVKKNVKAIGGNVTLASDPGKGTTVTIHVPLSLALMEVLLTEIDGEMYGLPLSCVVETVRIPPREIQVLNNREVILYQGQVLSVMDLGEILGAKPQAPLRTRDEDELLNVALIAFGGQIRAVAVDKILKPQQVLAKPLEGRLYNVRELAGAALLSDGRIALVLDQMGLF